MSELKRTAIHEAGHAVAFYRLFGESPRYGHKLTIDPHEGKLGSHSAEDLVFDGLAPLSADESQAFENEAIYACAGYAALRAAGYQEDIANSGCQSDFDIAEQTSNFPLVIVKEKAVELMTDAQNISAVERLVGELLSRPTLEWEEGEMLIDLADGGVSEDDYKKYMAMKHAVTNSGSLE